MKAAIDHHFVQNWTKFDTEMIESYQLVNATSTGIECCAVDYNDNNLCNLHQMMEVKLYLLTFPLPEMSS